MIPPRGIHCQAIDYTRKIRNNTRMNTTDIQAETQKQVTSPLERTPPQEQNIESLLSGLKIETLKQAENENAIGAAIVKILTENSNQETQSKAITLARGGMKSSDAIELAQIQENVTTENATRHQELINIASDAGVSKQSLGY